MAEPIPALVTMSSAGNTSAIYLDPLAKRTSVLIQTSSLVAGDYTLQFTLNVNETAVWNNISTTHYSSQSGAYYPDGLYLTYETPLAGLRLASTALSAGTINMKVIQTITAG